MSKKNVKNEWVSQSSDEIGLEDERKLLKKDSENVQEHVLLINYVFISWNHQDLLIQCSMFL